MKLLGFPLDGYDGDAPQVYPTLIPTDAIRFVARTPLKNWGSTRTYYEVMDEVAILLKLQYNDLIEYSWNVLGPYDDDEVKIICHRCGGGLFSVSGYEWKTNEKLQTYSCDLMPNGRCTYD